MICSVGQLANQKVSKPTCLNLYEGSLLLQRASQQGEIELPLELMKLKSIVTFLVAVSCFVSCKVQDYHTYLHFVVLTLWDYLTQGTSHTLYGLHSSSFHVWYLLYDCEPVLLGEAGFAKSLAEEIAAHKQFVQKETGHIVYYASRAKEIILMTTAPKSFLK